jgi:hypothetical protein
VLDPDGNNIEAVFRGDCYETLGRPAALDPLQILE